MPLTTILLRIALCFALVLNGSGNAVAAMHAMPMAGKTTHDAGGGTVHARSLRAAAPAVHVAADDSDCHGMQLAANGEEDAAGTDHPSEPDCCTSGACEGDCILHAAAIPIAWSTRVVVIAHVPPDASMPSGHATPTLPGEIRPPIG